MRHRIGIVGIVGRGSVLPAYAKTLRASEAIDIVALAGDQRDSTRRAAPEQGLPAMSFDDLLRSEAELIVCLTPPQSHHEIGLQALDAGKHLYVDAPLAMRFEHAAVLVDAAHRRGLRIGSAPDTFFGCAAQTARGLGVIDMLTAIERGEDHRCNEELALHVLEALEASLESARGARRVELRTRCERPRPLSAPLH